VFYCLVVDSHVMIAKHATSAVAASGLACWRQLVKCTEAVHAGFVLYQSIELKHSVREDAMESALTDYS